jgi:hypothetical protein
MSHVIELPDDLYRAIERYAAEHGETAEAVIIALAQSVAAQAGPAKPTGEQPAENGIDDPTRDPWAGFRGITTMLSPDSLERHDAYLAEEYTKRHESDQ